MNGPPPAVQKPPSLGDRLRDNWRPVVARFRGVELRKAPWVEPRRWAVLVLIGLVAVVVTGFLLDAWALGWGDELSRGPRGFFRWVTRYGKSDWLLIPTGVLVIVLAFGHWRRISRRIAAAWAEIGGLAAAFFLVVAIPGITIDIIKPIVGRWRPELLQDGAFGFSPFTFDAAYFSFPSGHATTVAAAAIFAVFAMPRRWGIAVAVAAGVIAISRVMVDAHHPSDVVGGVLAGLGVGYLVIRVLADARIGFTLGADGTIHPRTAVLRQLHRRREGGLALLFPNLWMALAPR